MRVLRTVYSRVAPLATLIVFASLVGCMELLEEPTSAGPPLNDMPKPSAMTSVTVRVAGPLIIAPARSSHAVLASAKGDHADITSVTVTVAGENALGNHQDPLATAALERTPDGVWAGTLSGLTVGPELDFAAEAHNGNGDVIFTGTHAQVLASVGAQITIRLNAVDDGVDNRLPKVTAISVSNVSTGVPAQVSVTVQGSGSEQLDYEFSGGTFDPASGQVTLASGTGTITSTYETPDIVGWYTAQIALSNAQGNRIEVDFQIQVRTASLTARIGPAVRAFTGKRTPAGVRWTANVSTAGDGIGVSYAWAFTDSENDAGTFTNPSANPTILTGYSVSTAGTLSVTVTDADGLTTTASVGLAAGLFPELTLMPTSAALVINEIDYDQDGSGDAAEFLEILNPGSGSVDLSGYRIELVDGADDEPYQSFESTAQLAAGGFLVLAKQAVIDDPNLVPAGTATLALGSASITNGPDGVRIVTKADGRVVDAVHYEGVVPGSGEGSPAAQDPATASTSIGRCPSGFDSNDNGLDFREMPATPGAANTCS